ncbi:hypothetical protein OSTOST_18287 [Ostertagia ostertagi]
MFSFRAPKANEEHAHRHVALDNRKCSHAELISMGGRLLQWFSDMHRIHSGREKELPEGNMDGAI